MLDPWLRSTFQSTNLQVGAFHLAGPIPFLRDGAEARLVLLCRLRHGLDLCERSPARPNRPGDAIQSPTPGELFRGFAGAHALLRFPVLVGLELLGEGERLTRRQV